MILALNVPFVRVSDLVSPDHIPTSAPTPVTPCRDGFGSWCSRIVAPQHAVEDLPAETLEFLLGSRCCETDPLSEMAWDVFSKTPPGWPRVQAICDVAHSRIAFGYQHARSTRTAREVLGGGMGCVATTPTSRSPCAAE